MNPLFRKLALYVAAHPRLAARVMKLGFNWFPAIRRTGGRITHVSPDVRHVRVTLPLNWRTRNINGTLFGGSMFAITDPIYMSLLYFNLGNDYVVWDKEGSIRFKRPGKRTLYADFRLDDAELAAVREALTQKPEIDRHYRVPLVDAEGQVYAEIERVLYIAHRHVYESKLAARRAEPKAAG
ncbi:DUF4442 domain-containing protein [Leeia sp.]|uniref:DUF4442 domain-containing protein n=1 Tax=Leeia sp. TaxID=2884678 RepID=UPI0035B4776B